MNGIQNINVLKQISKFSANLLASSSLRDLNLFYYYNCSYKNAL